jgi:hypothetical protein
LTIAPSNQALPLGVEARRSPTWMCCHSGWMRVSLGIPPWSRRSQLYQPARSQSICTSHGQTWDGGASIVAAIVAPRLPPGTRCAPGWGAATSASVARQRRSLGRSNAPYPPAAVSPTRSARSCRPVISAAHPGGCALGSGTIRAGRAGNYSIQMAVLRCGLLLTWAGSAARLSSATGLAWARRLGRVVRPCRTARCYGWHQSAGLERSRHDCC